jgi:hypothetical protein
MNALPRLASALSAGLLFGAGLALSGMMDPARVLGFLDVAGAWDPSLAFVLVGAVAVSALGYRITGRLERPLAARRFAIPTSVAIDRDLVVGSALFGIGWGLVGLCPGPALAGLTLGIVPIAVFVVAMLAGMLLHKALASKRAGAAGREIAR